MWRIYCGTHKMFIYLKKQSRPRSVIIFYKTNTILKLLCVQFKHFVPFLSFNFRGILKKEKNLNFLFRKQYFNVAIIFNKARKHKIKICMQFHFDFVCFFLF